jgi:hypothetical protein
VSILEQLLAKTGQTLADVSSQTTLGKLIRTRGVTDGTEFTRIKNLPRRDWLNDPELPKLIEALTNHFKTSNGAQTLLPMQAVALAELFEFGACVVANMGTGKSLVAFLAPVVLGAQRPLFLTYKKLIEKSQRQLASDATNWKVCENFSYLSVEKLSRGDELAALNPDLIVNDESHAFGNPSSKRSKILKAYLKANPTVKYLPLTGTPGEDSLKTQAHIAEWALREGSPFPRRWNELSQWCEALDAVSERRLAPGVLLELDDKPKASLDDVRTSVATRAAETPGYISYRIPDQAACSLYLSGLIFDGYGEATEAHFAAARDRYVTPDGYEFTEGSELWRVLRSMSLGFVHVIDPRPPAPWAEARREWNRFVSDDLAHNRSRRFSPGDVFNACKNGNLDSFGIFERWVEIKTTHKPINSIHWFDEAPLHFCAEWLAEEKALLWTPFPAFGERLSELSGVPFFGAGGRCGKLSIEEHPGGGAILSVGANVLGRNLQDRWNKALIVAPGSSGTETEQIIGRIHRQGQKKDCVEIQFLLGCIDNLDAVCKARLRQANDRTLNGNMASKLLVGDWLLPETIEGSSRRWKR